MVTKSPRPAPTRKPTPEPVDTPNDDKPNLLRAGLKALGNVRDDVVQHQSRVFEAILGIEPGAGWGGLVKRDAPATKLAQEALGLRKFEAVFDQRVASALERLGLPSPADWQALQSEVVALRAEVAALRKTRPAAKKATSRK